MVVRPIIPIFIAILLLVPSFYFCFKTKQKAQVIVRVLIVMLLFIINLRISRNNGNIVANNNNLDIIFVIDNTLSMRALDYNGNKERIEGVANDIEYIVSKTTGARHAVITFENNSYINMPLTKDSNAVLVLTSTFKDIDPFYAKGSNLTIFKEDLKQILSSSKKKDNRISIVFLFTDGESTNDDKLESLKELKKTIDGGAVLGYGTTNGGKMLVDYYGDGNTNYLQDRTNYPYVDAISKLDENNLKSISKDLGLSYIHMSKTSNIDKKLNEINKLVVKNDSSVEYGYDDLYYYFSIPLIILLLVELYFNRSML